MEKAPKMELKGQSEQLKPKAESNQITEIVTDSGTINLSPTIIRKYIARGNTDVTDQEVMLFLSLCKFQKLNPFLNEAYLIKFGSDAQIVVGKEVFTKRAYKDPRFKGMGAGVIVKRGENVIELEGAFTLPDDELLGGWAVVHRHDCLPLKTSVSMAEYDKGQSSWKKIPATMIRKTALVQALREAFPDLFQAMYDGTEMGQGMDVIESEMGGE